MQPTSDNVGITTTWSVLGLRSLKSNGLVDCVNYQVVCREQVGVGSEALVKQNRYCHTMDLEGSSPTIALADLTESNVIGWVKTGLGSTEIQRIEESILPPKTQYDYDSLREIREGNSLPWS
tara:strand:- start:25 stop:390 length:366 start_codon:yes stop_codon:yes gene_type:complete